MKRAIKHWWQRRTRGFDDSVTWSLDHEFAKWILPRLRTYREIAPHHIVINDFYMEALNEMIDGFATKIGEFEDDDYSVNEEKVKNGMNAFSEYWEALWW